MKNCKLPEVSTPVELDRLSLSFNVCRPRYVNWWHHNWFMVQTERIFFLSEEGGL